MLRDLHGDAVERWKSVYVSDGMSLPDENWKLARRQRGVDFLINREPCHHLALHCERKPVDQLVHPRTRGHHDRVERLARLVRHDLDTVWMGAHRGDHDSPPDLSAERLDASDHRGP